ncbi:uncharacterized protein TNCV_5133071 [Trichonephila clavipes]|nr:uncharacterized protein TNCV_5133071 [Trichonephila clavipes]
MLSAVPLGVFSNPGEGMDVCKCIVPLWHGGNLNSCRVACPLLRLVEEGRDYLRSVLPQNWGGTEPKRTVTCMMLKATDNDRRTTNPLTR